MSVAADTGSVHNKIWELTRSSSTTARLDVVFVEQRLLVLGLQAVLVLSLCLHRALALLMMTSARATSAMPAYSLSNDFVTIHRTPARIGHM